MSDVPVGIVLSGVLIPLVAAVANDVQHTTVQHPSAGLLLVNNPDWMAAELVPLQPALIIHYARTLCSTSPSLSWHGEI